MTSHIVRLPLAPSVRGEPRRVSLLEQFLREQQQPTAVERFTQHHAKVMRPKQERYYTDLLPARVPGEGEQYAFRVDLDACTGCKACVTACHSLNGLEEDETWRSVGLLHGGTPAAPARQSVTSACHHCLDPACMTGCPVLAYEKDARTGIVHHLDDQCIGCQYCTFTCPHGAPQYSARLGIVRKCDMCTDRLAVSEAPACVQGCPNEAIAITVASQRKVREGAHRESFLPGAPSPALTYPTTQYETTRVFPPNMLPADHERVAPAERHVPLVVMLVLTQMAVGALTLDPFVGRLLLPAVAERVRPIHAAAVVAVGLVALGASVLHLGRPRYAFRALLGLRTSWMSREILAFGLFAPLSVAYALALGGAHVTSFFGAQPPSPGGLRCAEDVLAALVISAGVSGVVCSTLLYHVTRRPWWSGFRTGFRFAMTALVLGLATHTLTLATGAFLSGGALTAETVGTSLARALLAAVVLELVGEAEVFVHLRDPVLSPLRRSALLMARDLAPHAVARFATGLLGAGAAAVGAFGGPSLTARFVAATAAFALLAAGELIGRTLFFAAVSSPGMPGGLE